MVTISNFYEIIKKISSPFKIDLNYSKHNREVSDSWNCSKSIFIIIISKIIVKALIKKLIITKKYLIKKRFIK
jgi:hypothetical protein